MENQIFPGRPNYTGPPEGVFGLLHHDLLVEMSKNVFERVEYVRRVKPRSEVEIRLHNMIYLGGCDAAAQYLALHAAYREKLAQLHAAYMAKCAPLYVAYMEKIDALDAAYRAKLAPLEPETITYIKRYIPDCAWDGNKLNFEMKKGKED